MTTLLNLIHLKWSIPPSPIPLLIIKSFFLSFFLSLLRTQWPLCAKIRLISSSILQSHRGEQGAQEGTGRGEEEGVEGGGPPVPRHQHHVGVEAEAQGRHWWS